VIAVRAEATVAGTRTSGLIAVGQRPDRVLLVDPVQVGASQIRLGEVRLGEARVREVRVAEAGAAAEGPERAEPSGQIPTSKAQRIVVL